MPTTRQRRRPAVKRVPRPLGVTAAEGASAHHEKGASTKRNVLIATDGSRAASAAMKVARLMAERGSWAPEVLTVMQQLPVSVGDMMLPAPALHYEAMVTENIAQGIRQQMKRYGDASWRLALEFGPAAVMIVQAARERHADLIVLGLARHGRLARLFGAETAARVVRHSDIPVVAVPAGTRKLPGTALVAVDFGESSVRAAREALTLLEPPARLHLVHVKSSWNTTSIANSEWERAYAVGVEAGFKRLREQLGARSGIAVTTSLLTGLVIEQLLDEAKSIHADLIALGSHGQNVFDRLMVGSTPTDVLRLSHCSVLVTPSNDAQL
jgi:nucleotide-binding universal stress UspA family protein